MGIAAPRAPSVGHHHVCPYTPALQEEWAQTMFLHSSTTLTAQSAAEYRRPTDAGPGDEPAWAVDRLPDGTWQLTLRDLEPVSVRRLPSDEVRIILAPAHAEPARPVAAAGLPYTADAPPDPIQINVAARTVSVEGHQLLLPRLEFDLLAHLVRHPHRAYTRQQLMAAVWPDSRSSTRTVDVHIARLRRRLGPRRRASISTVFGIGYKYLPLL